MKKQTSDHRAEVSLNVAYGQLQAEVLQLRKHIRQLQAQLAQFQGQQPDTQTHPSEIAQVHSALPRSRHSLGQVNHLQWFLRAVLLQSTQAIAAAAGAVFVYDAATNTLQNIACVLQQEEVDIAIDPRMEIWRGPIPAQRFPNWETLRPEGEIVWLDHSTPQEDGKWEIIWHQQMGHRMIIRLPIAIGGTVLGLLELCFCERHSAADIKLEQCWSQVLSDLLSPPTADQPRTSPICLLVADDHPAMREGLSALLEKQPDFQVVALAKNGTEAIAQFRQHQPDVMLMDLRLPEVAGIDVVSTLRAEFPSSRIIILTTYDGDEDIYRALRAGAAGYLLKNVACQELFEAIRKVYRGQKYVMSSVAQKLTERFSDAELTEREMDVLRLMVQGKSNRKISTELCIVEGTVKFHVRNILEKLGASDRTQAVMIALKRGLARL